MNRRIALPLLAALAATALPGVASAAAKRPICLQITDGTGDSGITNPADGSAVGPSFESLDIVSADIATGKKNLVAVLRLKTLAADPALVGGATYNWTWKVGEVTQVLTYRIYATGGGVATFDADGSGTAATEREVKAVTSPGTATITWTVPRRDVPTLKKAGAKLTGLTVQSSRANNAKVAGGSMHGSSQADSATTSKSYKDLTATCVKGT